MKTDSPQSLIVADLQSHALGGHFATWFGYTLREAGKHFEHLKVYVADEVSRPSRNLLETIPAQVSVSLIPEIYKQYRSHGNILGVLAQHHAEESGQSTEETPLFLMWAQQFLEQDQIFPPRRRLRDRLRWSCPARFCAPWGTMTSVSSVAHHAEEIPEMERRIHEMAKEEKKCVGVLLWDEYAVKSLGGKYLYLPDVESCEGDPLWKFPIEGRITLGSVGQLWGGRSVNLLAEILEHETGLMGYLGGVFKPHSYTERAVRMINEGKRVTVDKGFVERDEELNQRLRRVDAFVIDSRTYKCPSGLTIRAMAMGRPIVAVDSPSWIANLIREQGIGVFWDRDSCSLESKLREWSDSGGSQRSIASAKKLSDQVGMEKAFAEILARLKEASGR